MNVMTCDQVKCKDAMAMMRFGVPGMLLMEHAALATLHEMERRNLVKGKIVVACGRGNNGGDGYALARLLFLKGADVTVVKLFDMPPKGADAGAYLDMVQRLKIPFGTPADFETADVIVDAMFGTGMKRELNDFCRDIVERINQSKAAKVCIDLPSGMDGDETFQKNPMVQGDLTVTFTAYKPGLLFYPSAYAAGEVVAVKIGIPDTLGDDMTCVIDRAMVREALPKRDPAGHKNSFGHVLVTGGSTGMTGAPVLSAQTALLCGCGLVTAAVPAAMLEIVEQKLTEVMTLPLEDRHTGQFDPEAKEVFLQRAEQADAVVFGPGARTGQGTEALLHALLQTKSKIVIDADGLNVLSGHMQWLADRSCEACILTPHPGEMARLAGVSVSEIEENRIEFARNFAKQYRVHLVLKGARTVVATPKGRVYVNLFGNAGMATAGAGDVLAGAAGSLLAQGVPEEQAAFCAVALHALAGDMAAEQLGQAGVTAGSISRQIPLVMKQMLEK